MAGGGASSCLRGERIRFMLLTLAFCCALVVSNRLAFKDLVSETAEPSRARQSVAVKAAVAISTMRLTEPRGVAPGSSNDEPVIRTLVSHGSVQGEGFEAAAAAAQQHLPGSAAAMAASNTPPGYHGQLPEHENSHLENSASLLESVASLVQQHQWHSSQWQLNELFKGSLFSGFSTSSESTATELRLKSRRQLQQQEVASVDTVSTVPGSAMAADGGVAATGMLVVVQQQARQQGAEQANNWQQAEQQQGIAQQGHEAFEQQQQAEQQQQGIVQQGHEAFEQQQQQQQRLSVEAGSHSALGDKAAPSDGLLSSARRRLLQQAAGGAMGVTFQVLDTKVEDGNAAQQQQQQQQQQQPQQWQRRSQQVRQQQVMAAAAGSSKVVQTEVSLRRYKGRRIPRIIHQIYFPGEGAYQANAQLPGAFLQTAWRESCRVHHPRWKYYFWNITLAERFLEQRFPAFLPVFRAYPNDIYRADAFRYFVLRELGGMYLDLDVECFQAVDRFFGDAQLVLQGQGTLEALANGMIASTPHHPIWDKVIARLVKQSELGPEFMQGDARRILHVTGSKILSEMVMSELGLVESRENLPGRHRSPALGTVVVYPLGEWYIPCQLSNNSCFEDLAVKRADGTYPLGRVAGYHRYSRAWDGRKPQVLRVKPYWSEMGARR